MKLRCSSSALKCSNDAIQKVDILLYQAKNDGRNKIILEDGLVI
jgi:PleD family two-component response regulator